MGHMIRVHMREVKIVHAALKIAIQESGHKLREQRSKTVMVHRSTLVENSVAGIDGLLVRAVNLPIKIAYLHEVSVIRARLAAEAALCRRMEELAKQVDLWEMEEALAQASNFKIEGTLVERVQKQLEEVKK